MKRLRALGPIILFVASSAHAEPRYENAIRGPFALGSFGTSRVGDAIMVEIGGELAGIRSYDERRWLLQWDVAASGKFGWLGNQHPFLFLVGVRAAAWAEAGHRLMPSRIWSPYVGARVGDEVQILEHPGLAADALDTINESGAGVRARGLVRFAGGLSMLDNRRSLLLVGFVQEAFQARGPSTPVLAFTQIGLGARFDLAGSVIAEIDAAWGVTPDRTDPALGLVDQTTRAGVSCAFRKIFGNGLWVGTTVGLSRDTDRVTYVVTHTTYGTGNAPVFDAALFLGWSPRRPK